MFFCHECCRKTCLKTEKYFSPYLKKVFIVIFVKKRPEITSKHLYFDRNPGKRLYSNLYLKNIDEFCLFCTLYLKKIDEVQVHGTFVLEMKIDLKYNLGYRMSTISYGSQGCPVLYPCPFVLVLSFCPLEITPETT